MAKTVFCVDASSLRHALAQVRPAVDLRGQGLAPHVRLGVGECGGLAVSANRGSAAMRAACPCVVESGDGVAVVVPFERIDPVAALYGDAPLRCVFDSAKLTLAIRAGKTEHVLRCVDAADWAPEAWDGSPDGEEPREGAPAIVPAILAAGDWARMLGSTVGCISPDENRYGLNGLALELVDREGKTELRAVATDGSRLAWAQGAAPASVPLDGVTLRRKQLIPREFVAVLAKIAASAEAEALYALALGERWASWGRVDLDGGEVGASKMRFRLIEGEFPDYRLVVPPSVKRTCAVGVAALRDALKAVGLAAVDRNISVRVAFEEGRMLLSARDASAKGSEVYAEVECELDGAPMATGFNGRFLTEMLAAVQGAQVVAHMGEALDPTIWLGEAWPHRGAPLTQAGAGVVIMPMRLD